MYTKYYRYLQPILTCAITDPGMGFNLSIVQVNLKKLPFSTAISGLGLSTSLRLKKTSPGSQKNITKYITHLLAGVIAGKHLMLLLSKREKKLKQINITWPKFR